jgi:hypothetical protein
VTNLLANSKQILQVMVIHPVMALRKLLLSQMFLSIITAEAINNKITVDLLLVEILAVLSLLQVAMENLLLLGPMEDMVDRVLEATVALNSKEKVNHKEITKVNKEDLLPSDTVNPLHSQNLLQVMEEHLLSLNNQFHLRFQLRATTKAEITKAATLEVTVNQLLQFQPDLCLNLVATITVSKFQFKDLIFHQVVGTIPARHHIKAPFKIQMEIMANRRLLLQHFQFPNRVEIMADNLHRDLPATVVHNLIHHFRVLPVVGATVDLANNNKDMVVSSHLFQQFLNQTAAIMVDNYQFHDLVLPDTEADPYRNNKVLQDMVDSNSHLLKSKDLWLNQVAITVDRNLVLLRSRLAEAVDTLAVDRANKDTTMA